MITFCAGIVNVDMHGMQNCGAPTIREVQVLSLVPSKDKNYDDSHLIETGSKGLPKLVSSAAIYGPNGAGKSNLILAISFMKNFMYESAAIVHPGQLLQLHWYFKPYF